MKLQLLLKEILLLLQQTEKIILLQQLILQLQQATSIIAIIMKNVNATANTNSPPIANAGDDATVDEATK